MLFPASNLYKELHSIAYLAKGGVMISKLARFLFKLISIIVVLAIILGVAGIFIARRSFPKTSGTVTLSGLDDPVDIYRDSFGIPQIYASTSHDLFFAQGYVHAQDRFWQMDFWRHLGSARLSEMFGDSQADTDVFLRTLGWARVAQREIDAMSPEDLAPLQAYADGVNAYLADHKGSALSLEYAVLKLTNAKYEIEPWQPLNTLTWGKAMAWDLGSGRLFSEAGYPVLLKTFSEEQIRELYPLYPSDNPVIDTQYPNTPSGGSADQSPASQILSGLSPAFESILKSLSNVETVLGPSGSSIGSNNWVIAGSRTSTGMPFLANDMHLSEQMPSIWYEIGLHCTPKGSQCPFEVTGFSFPGAPGVIVGHNDRIAWGFTNVGPDVIDLYIEKINPDNPNQYEVNGAWVDMTLVNETIQVAGSDPVDLVVRYTRHGPLIWDSPKDNATFQQKWGIELPSKFAISVRWTALEPVQIFKAVLGYDRAQNWDEFRQAASYFAVPSQNSIFADVDGNIGYQMPGNIPIRLPGHGGNVPVPGWTDEYEWQGYIPFDELPSVYNPPEGYIVSANNAVVGPGYPYYITNRWDSGFRAARIVQLIEDAPAAIDAAYIQKMHGDNYNASAAYLVPILLQLDLPDQHLVGVRELLNGWDFQDQMDLAAPVVYNSFWRAVLARTLHDDLSEDDWPDGDSPWFVTIRQLVAAPDSPWWDDKNTPAVEKRDDILSLAFADAVSELEGVLGTDSSRWAWGDLHTVTFHNQTLGVSGIAPIESIFNRGPFRTSGGNSIVNATGWSAAEPDAAQAYQVAWLPSERLIVDLSDLQASLSVITTGESGHAFHRNYVDQADLWRTIQYHPMLWESAQVEAAAKNHLTLAP
jgi:penicillin amidase